MNGKSNKRGLEAWEVLIRECLGSGLSRERWCSENDVSIHAFYYWYRKLRAKGVLVEGVPVLPDGMSDEGSAFVEVSFEQGSPDATPAADRLPEVAIQVKGYSVQVYGNVTGCTLATVMGVLANA